MTRHSKPKIVPGPEKLLRLARKDLALNFSRIRPSDHLLPHAGNRYDVPGAGVLYGADTAATCLIETLARFRPSAAVLKRLAKAPLAEREQFMPPGSIPREWRLQRRIFTIELINPLPFVDVESGRTISYLDQALAQTLISFGYEQPLDLAVLRNQDRRLSRAIAQHFYTRQDELGNPLYAGLRYRSRLDNGICWAVFDGTEVRVDAAKTAEITLEHPDLIRILADWGMKAF